MNSYSLINPVSFILVYCFNNKLWDYLMKFQNYKYTEQYNRDGAQHFDMIGYTTLLYIYIYSKLH